MRSYIAALASAFFLQYGFSQNTPDLEIINSKLSQSNIICICPGNVLLPKDGRIDTEKYYLLATPDTTKIHSRPLLYLKEGLDSLAEMYSKDNPDMMFLVHDPKLISEQVASRIYDRMHPRNEVKRRPEYLEDAIKNYPNPFNGTTNISITIPEDGKVNLRIFDMVGREYVILDQFMQKGTNTIRYNMAEFPTGMYIARFDATTSGKTLYSTAKMLLIK